MIKRKPLVWQLYPSYLLLVLIALLATSWYASRSMRSFFMTQIHKDLFHQARLLAPQFLPLLVVQNPQQVDHYCKQIVLDVPTRLTIIRPDGTVVGDSEKNPKTMDNHGDRPEVVDALTGRLGYTLRYSDTLKQQMMYLAMPIQVNGIHTRGDDTKGDVKGVVRVSIALTEIKQQLSILQREIIFGGLVIALLASIVCLIISRRISRPIELMRQSATRFAQGELEHRLIPPNTKELAELAQAMNQMAQELENRMQAITRQRNESEAVLSSMVEGVVALDVDERILHLNSAAAQLLNGALKQLPGRSIQEVVRNRELHQMVQATLVQGTVNQGDVALYGSGEQILSAQCTPLFDTDKRRIGALLVLNDVTQLRRLETMRSDFAANVSHEVKTPLTAIQGFVETLCQGSVTDQDEAQRFLLIIQKHVHRLNAIVDDLMQLARLEQSESGGKLRLETAIIKQILESAVQLCRPKANEKAMQIDIQCDETISTTMDVDLMEQAAVNLLDNAIKYSPDNSEIILSAEVKSNEVLVHFQDKGMGIAAVHLPRLFERFYRVDKARSRREGGTGLGLAIVKHIVQTHGGKVTVQSVQGKGSTFTIHLPR